MAIVDEVIKLAQSQVGYAESPLGSNHNKYAQYFDNNDGAWQWFNGKKQNVAWCAIWICWLFVMVLRPILGNADKVRQWLKFPKPADNCAAGCPYLWQYLVNRGWKVDKTKGQRGDIIFFNAKCTHVGIIEKVENGKYYTIEGNKSNKVARGTYAYNSTSIYGLCRPNYSDLEPKPEPDPLPHPTPEPVNPVESNLYKVVNIKSFLAIRTKPSSNGKKVGELYNDAIVSVLEQKDGWGKITGDLWVYMGYLKKV